jgi:ribosomal protein L37AE/L43A
MEHHDHTLLTASDAARMLRSLRRNSSGGGRPRTANECYKCHKHFGARELKEHIPQCKPQCHYCDEQGARCFRDDKERIWLCRKCYRKATLIASIPQETLEEHSRELYLAVKKAFSGSLGIITGQNQKPVEWWKEYAKEIMALLRSIESWALYR